MFTNILMKGNYMTIGVNDEIVENDHVAKMVMRIIENLAEYKEKEDFLTFNQEGFCLEIGNGNKKIREIMDLELLEDDNLDELKYPKIWACRNELGSYTLMLPSEY